jgi:Baseplate J-like protein
MTTTAPRLDPRTAAAIRDQVTSDLATNLGGAWVPAGDQASAALISIIARFGEIVIERLNQAPDKNFLAFLDLLGTTPLPPEPARVPLTFTVAAGSTTDAVVPAGTQAAAPPGEGETDPTVFETERELTAVAASLQTLVAADAERDLIADHSVVLAAPVTNGLRVFVADRVNEHVFYMAHSALLSLPHLDALTLSVQVSADSPAASDARVLQWEVWDGANGIPLPPPSSDTTQQLRVSGTVSFANLTQVSEQLVNGVTNRWLRCRLLTPVSAGSAPAQGMVRVAQLPLLESIGLSAALSGTGLVPDVAFANDQAVDVTRAFLPFGEKPRIGDVFYISQRAAFGQPGGAITLHVALASSPPPPPGVPSSDLTLKWEAWDGSKWALLGTTTPNGATGGGSLVDNDKAFTTSNTVTFTLPASLGPGTVNGVESNWVRVQIVAGNYGVDSTFTRNANTPGGFDFNPPTFAPPLISSLSVDFTVATTPTAPDAVFAFNNAQFEDLASALAAGAAAPFAGLPTQQSALYAAFTLPPARQSFPNHPVSLYHGVRQPPYGEKPIPVSPELSVQSATAGSTVVHHFTLVNTSSDSVDCQLVTFGGAWTSSLAPEQRNFSLSPGATDVQVSVAVPASAQLPAADVSDRGFLTVRLSSDSVVHAVGFETRVGTVAPRRRDLRFEYWNGTAWTRLVASDTTDLLERPGIVEFIGPADFTPTQLFGTSAYWMRALFEPGDEPQPQLRTLRPNTTFATNTVTLRNEVIGTSDASASQTFHTTRTPVLAGPQLEVREAGPPSAEELVALAAPNVNVVTPVPGSSEVWVRWVEVADFHGSGPTDRHYVLDHVTGEVRFGDGVQGRIPPRGIGNVRMARYQTGGGAIGNRAAGTIVQLHNSVAFIDSVTNIEPAEGGFDAESTAAMLTRAPRSLRHGGRAVALEDYEDLARAASPEVARAKTIPARQLRDDPLGNTPVPGAVSVIVVPQSTAAKPVPSVGLIAEVQDSLQALVTPTVSLAVIGPVYVRVDVTVEIALVSLDGANQVEDAVGETLRRFLHPLIGGRDGTGWNFGRQPFLSDLFAVVSDVPGVDHIRHLSTNLVEEPVGALLSGRFLVYSGQHQIALTFVGAE